MKRLFLISVLLLSGFYLQAQSTQYSIPPDTNYLEFINWLVFEDSLIIPKDSSEGGLFNHSKRAASIWGPRLFPSGSIKTAAEAVNQYACGYNFSPSDYDPNWTCLGPTGLPNVNGSGSGNGMIIRLLFDPRYHDINSEGKLGFERVYASSQFGGLWRSEDEGENWELLNTDLQLPFTNVSDVAISYDDAKVIFLSTGDGDTGFRLLIKDHRSTTIAPSFTSGVFRSIDDGQTWEAINGAGNSLCFNHFNDEGGHITKLLCHPNNHNILFFASSEGVFRTLNAMASPESVIWEKVLSTPDNNGREPNWRGLAFKPDGTLNPTIYASGEDIWKSEDNGNTWTSMTGNGTGLDFVSLQTAQYDDGFCDGNDDGCTSEYQTICNANPQIPRSFTPIIINIATSPDDPERLTAYILGSEEYRSDNTGNNCANYGGIIRRDRMFIYIYVEDPVSSTYSWHLIHSALKSDVSTLTFSRMPIAVSPINANHIYFGTVKVFGTDHNTTLTDLLNYPAGGDVFTAKSISNGQNGEMHADIHSLEFEPKTTPPRVFCGDDGGIHQKISTQNGTSGWSASMGGLQVATIWAFDFNNNHTTPLRFGTSNQDCGTNIVDASNWNWINGGDGFGFQFDERNQIAFFRGNSARTLRRLDIDTQNETSENSFFPERRPVEDINVLQGIPRDLLPASFKIFSNPKTGNTIWAFYEVYERIKAIPDGNPPSEDDLNPRNVWDLRSDISKAVLLNYRRELHEFTVFEPNPDYMYVSTEGAYLKGPNGNEVVTNRHSRLFTTTTGGCTGYDDYDTGPSTIDCWSEIDLNGIPKYPSPFDEFPIISCLAVHPGDPDILYVTFTGYNANAKVFKWKRSPNGGEAEGTWTDVASNSLNNLPVNFIACQKGTDERLYIGTDAGVYVKDASMSEWEKYGNFPNVRVTELKIDYCRGKIYASTFGRGLWEGDLLPFEDLGEESAIVIDESQTWDTPRYLEQNIIILPGNTLTITSEVHMPLKGKIIVQPGARMSIDGGLLTNSCDEMWQGVEVWGNSSLPQLLPHQGYLRIKNGGTIEHAVEAIRVVNPEDPSSTGGGIIYVEDANFINNGRSVEFIYYPDFHNHSVFHKSTFRIDNDFRGDDFKGHFTMFMVRGVQIYGCSFINSRIGFDPVVNLSNAIRTGNSTYFVSNSGDRATTFNGFDIAVYSANTIAGYTFTIDSSMFRNNHTGIHALSVPNFRVTECIFNIGNLDGYYGGNLIQTGISNYYGTGFFIQENEFIGDDAWGTVGIQTYHTGEEKNLIRKNKFSFLEVANCAEEQNRSSLALDPEKGLRFECNVNENNVAWDFQTAGTDQFGGVALYQGSSEKTAGNRFSLNTSPIGSDFNNQVTYPVIYWHYDDQNNNTTREEPENISSNILKSESFIQNPCDSEMGDEDTEILSIQEETTLINSYNSEKVTYDSLKIIHSTLIDGGNTEGLLNQVQNALPVDSTSLISLLNSYTPYVSGSVLKSMADKPTVFTHSTASQIMGNNPDGVREVSLLEYLPIKPSPLPQSYIDIVEQNVGNRTVRTVLEESIFEKYSSIIETANRLLRSELIDTNTVDQSNLRIWYSNKESILSTFSVAESYLAEGQYALTNQTINSMGNVFQLTSQGLQEKQQFLEMKKFQIKIDSTDKTYYELDSTEIQQLAVISQRTNTLGGHQASFLLDFFYEGYYHPQPTCPQGETRAYQSANKVKQLLTASKSVNVYPNPADKHVFFELYLPEGAGSFELVIFNVEGKIVKSFTVIPNNDNLSWEVSILPPGLYYYAFQNDRQILEKGKFIISR